MTNYKHYRDKLTYEVGEMVFYRGKNRKIVFKHESGLFNVENGIFYIHNVHPMFFHKLNCDCKNCNSLAQS